MSHGLIREFWHFCQRFALRAPNGFRLSAYLVLALIGMQGVEVSTRDTSYRMLFLGASGVATYWLVGCVSTVLIVAQCILTQLASRVDILQSVMRMRERGFGLHEVRQEIPHPLATIIFGIVAEHSSPVCRWHDAKLREILQSSEFARVATARMTRERLIERTGQFLSQWRDNDASFREKFVEIDDLLNWLLLDVR